MVGNDIVDYGIDEQKYRQPRFLNRVLTVKEQSYLAQSCHPNTYLWSLWAAKEAAFKALQRTENHLTFSPITFELPETSLQALLSCHESKILKGDVQHKNQTIEVRFSWPEKNAVHCIACCQSNTDYWPHIDSRITHSANLSNYQQQSQAVRKLAQQLLKHHNINAEISRPTLNMKGYHKPGPPILIECETGHVLAHLISLSHDNNYLAVALCLIQ